MAKPGNSAALPDKRQAIEPKEENVQIYIVNGDATERRIYFTTHYPNPHHFHSAQVFGFEKPFAEKTLTHFATLLGVAGINMGAMQLQRETFRHGQLIRVSLPLNQSRLELRFIAEEDRGIFSNSLFIRSPSVHVFNPTPAMLATCQQQQSVYCLNHQPHTAEVIDGHDHLQKVYVDYQTHTDEDSYQKRRVTNLGKIIKEFDGALQSPTLYDAVLFTHLERYSQKDSTVASEEPRKIPSKKL